MNDSTSTYSRGLTIPATVYKTPFQSLLKHFKTYQRDGDYETVILGSNQIPIHGYQAVKPDLPTGY